MVRGKTGHALIAAALLSLTQSAFAQDGRPAYDRRIEEAAIARVQTKLGEMRGPLGLYPARRFNKVISVKRTEPWVWLEFPPPADSSVSG